MDYNNILGQGGFGSVYNGRYFGKEVAVKICEVDINEG